jgi:Putative Actinobacterial Holin-X, holin superfamily III
MEEQSAGELVKQLSEQVSLLVRDEMKMARLELTRKGKQAGMGAGMFGVSGLVALYGVACLLAAAIIAPRPTSRKSGKGCTGERRPAAARSGDRAHP